MKRLVSLIIFLIVIIIISACGAASPGETVVFSGEVIPEQPTPAGNEIENEAVAEDAVPEKETEDADANGAFITDGIESGELLPAKVTRVVDGDTIVVSLDGAEERARLIGIDTPESVHSDASKNVPYGKISSDFTKSSLDGKDVFLELDVEERDRYGRLLAYVYIDGTMFNKTLLDEGHAMISTYPPNIKYVDAFTKAQTAAREAEKGLWAPDAAADLSPPPEPSSGGQGDPQEGGQSGRNAKYIGTVNSYKFHDRNCEWGKKILEKNAVYFNTRDEAIAAGFVPCKVCRP